VVETIAYDEHYGRIIKHWKREDVETLNPYGYTGREIETNELYYYRARYYDAGMQRFLSRDPIGFASGDFNFYRYVGNSPVVFVDPFGLEVKVCSRWLGGKDAWDSWKINPLRHDYIVINGEEIFSFQAGTDGYVNAIWSKGRVEDNNDSEKPNRDSCLTVWAGHEHDQYVRDEEKKIKDNPPQYGIGPQATDCQEVSEDIINKASINYDIDNEDFPQVNDDFQQDNHTTKPTKGI